LTLIDNHCYQLITLSEAKYIIYEKLNKEAQSITNDEGGQFRPVGSFLDYVNKTFVPTFKEKYNSDNEAFSDFENANFDDDDIGNIAVYSKPDFLDSNCRFSVYWFGRSVVYHIYEIDNFNKNDEFLCLFKADDLRCFINENIVKHNNLNSLFSVKSLDELDIKIKDCLFLIVDSFLKDKISFQLNYLDNHYVILNIENRCVSDYDGFYCRIIQVFRNQTVLLNYDL
jgi:hypothetical protein